MTPSQIAVLAVQGVVFIVWAFFWFRTLFRLKREADAERARRSVGYFGGIQIVVGMFGKFFTHPDYAPDRRIVLGTTAALFAIIGAQWFWFTGGAG